MKAKRMSANRPGPAQILLSVLRVISHNFIYKIIIKESAHLAKNPKTTFTEFKNFAKSRFLEFKGIVEEEHPFSIFSELLKRVLSLLPFFFDSLARESIKYHSHEVRTIPLLFLFLTHAPPACLAGSPILTFVSLREHECFFAVQT
jgi:hypothetical protein